MSRKPISIEEINQILPTSTAGHQTGPWSASGSAGNSSHPNSAPGGNCQTVKLPELCAPTHDAAAFSSHFSPVILFSLLEENRQIFVVCVYSCCSLEYGEQTQMIERFVWTQHYINAAVTSMAKDLSLVTKHAFLFMLCLQNITHIGKLGREIIQ